MPKPHDGETRDEFLKRCIPMVIDDGTAESNDQAVAICSSIWENRDKDESGTGKMLYSPPIQVQEIKADGAEWEVSGYVSIFNNVDLGRDVVRIGAFKKTLRSGPKVRFLLSHDPRLVLGVPKSLKEDSKGLFGRFKISKTALGSDTRQLLLDGAIDSFSFGYDADTFEIDQKEGLRYLKDVTLYEASLVPVPMNPEAVVTGVKDNLTQAERINHLIAESKQLLDEIHGLIEKGRPLNETKRQELAELLEKFSGMDDVRSDLQSVLSAAPTRLVEAYQVRYRLAELRKRQL